MNEDERAKRLSEAIDILLQGGQPEPDLNDDELIEILRIARLRHQVGQARAATAHASRELALRVLKARILARQMKQKTEGEPPL